MSETELIRQPERTALTDLQAQAMGAISVDAMRHGLAEYFERRKVLREALLSEMKEGTHFAFAPGTEPKYCDANGKEATEAEATHIKTWNRDKWQVVSLKAWTPKRGLLKGGADFVCDAMKLVPVFTFSEEGARQLGGKDGVVVLKCQLFPKGAPQTAEFLVGEGHGVGKVGDRKADENNATKMAEKRAKVNAVINAYGLSDLFVQDADDVQPEPLPSAPQKPDAPKAQPREHRVTVDDRRKLFLDWKNFRALQGKPTADSEFESWVGVLTGMTPQQVAAIGEWTAGDLEQCKTALKQEMGL